MMKYMTLLLGVAFLAGCCCTNDSKLFEKTSYKTAMGTEYVSAALSRRHGICFRRID